jgi:hypothetical protein
MNTTRCLMLAAGIIVSASIHAETKVYADPDLFAAFPDKSSIQRRNTISQMLVLFSYKHMKSVTVYHTGKNDTFYYSATKVLLEFDCEKNRSKIIKTFFYSDNEAKKGLVYEQSSIGEWKNETDRSNPKSLIQAACDSN